MPRNELLQEFFESITSLNRAIGVSKSFYSKGERRHSRERRRPQSDLLYLLTRKKELTIKSVAAALRITSSAATQMVEGLVGEGFLERTSDPDDRRVVRVRLSSKGKAEFAKFRKAHVTRIGSVLKNLSNEELKLLIKIRSKVLGE